MFKPCTMSSSNLTHCNNKWPNHIFSKEESEEDSASGLEVEEEDLAIEEDEVMNQSTAIHVGCLGITIDSALMRNAHIVQVVMIMLKVSLS